VKAKRVIVNADDFGLALPVNEAVERAHREGVLTTASLMAGEPGADDAMRRARALPTLRVGLHVVLVHGTPVLAPAEIPDLVGPDGQFSKNLAATGVKYFFHPRIRRQLEVEIRAQFARARAGGVVLDHVNAQCHFHLHPTVLGIIMRVARDYGSPPIRVPYEPFLPSWRANHDRAGARFANAVFLAPWLTLMKMRLRAAGIPYNDCVFGLSDVGAMTRERVVAFARELPPGVTEVFFHAATGRWPSMAPELAPYLLEEELAALTSGEVATALRDAGAERIAFSDLRAHAG
jgi:hopanoid biosynthesis associated protein HpnK